MKRVLQISIASNVLLAAAFSFLFFWGRQQPVAPIAVVELPASIPKLSPLDWKQIDSPDFLTFIANLRAAGCPEATIRDIITGELTEIYAEQEQQTPAAATQPTNHTTPSPAPARTAAQIQAERDRAIAALLHPAPDESSPQTTAAIIFADAPDAGGAVSPATTTAAVVETIPPRARGPTYPAVAMHNTVPATSSAAQASANGSALAAPQMSPQEQAMLDKINGDFVNAVGGPDQDPNDPAYQARWDAAQAESDAQYKKFFGGRAYVQKQIQAARQAVIDQQAAAQK